MTEKVRIQKYLSQLGLYSRREAEALLSDGKIRVNGTVVKDLGTKIDPETDRLKVNNKPIVVKEPPKVYWLLHKPDGCLTAAKAQRGKPCIYDLASLAKIPFKVFPVGRLDFNTEGLLLLSNDGELVFRLSHPKFKLPRRYHVLVSRRLVEDEQRTLHQGVKLSDGVVKDVGLRFVTGQSMGKTRGFWYEVTVHEGRNRLVRRLFEHFDIRVLRLIRTGFGDLDLEDELKPGNYRQLKAKEISYLKRAVELIPPKAARST